MKIYLIKSQGSPIQDLRFAA
uniref:Uncharacterized protein n=1 Tax=Rhizophora mucronata TaxID=61149 RepID=A0A2P2N4A3_RHIMU